MYSNTTYPGQELLVSDSKYRHQLIVVLIMNKNPPQKKQSYPQTKLYLFFHATHGESEYRDD